MGTRGVPAYDVARYMGTSVRMLDLTYGHLVKGSEAVAVSRLDAYTRRNVESFGPRFGHMIGAPFDP